MTETLDPLERDALAELGNIGMGKASTALSRMVGGEVLVSVPTIEVVPGAAMAAVLARAMPGPLVAVAERLSGSFRGSAILVVPERASLPLAGAVLPPDLPKDAAADMEDEALGEVGNIVLNSCLSLIANLLGAGIGTTLPEVRRGDAAEIVERCGVQTGPGALAILFHVTFRVMAHDVNGEIVLALDAGSSADLQTVIRGYIGRVLAAEA